MFEADIVVVREPNVSFGMLVKKKKNKKPGENVNQNITTVISDKA